MSKQLSLDLGQQFNPVRTHKSGPYTLTYQVGDTHGDVTHVTDPNDVIDRIPVGRAPKRALNDWHAKLQENIR